jgi:hypothetical protein
VRSVGRLRKRRAKAAQLPEILARHEKSRVSERVRRESVTQMDRHTCVGVSGGCVESTAPVGSARLRQLCHSATSWHRLRLLGSRARWSARGSFHAGFGLPRDRLWCATGAGPFSARHAHVKTMFTVGSILVRLRAGRRSFMALALIAGACLAVLIGALRARPGKIARRLSDEERKTVGSDMAANEPGWIERAAAAFPGDSWSQEDDFAKSEYEQARSQAGRFGAHVGDALRAADESLRAQSAGRRVGVSACKPRPFYD